MYFIKILFELKKFTKRKDEMEIIKIIAGTKEIFTLFLKLKIK